MKHDEPILFPVCDAADLEVALAEINQRLPAWAARVVVSALIEAGITSREDLEATALAVVPRAIAMLRAAYAQRAVTLAAEMARDDDFDDDAPRVITLQ